MPIRVEYEAYCNQCGCSIALGDTAQQAELRAKKYGAIVEKERSVDLLAVVMYCGTKCKSEAKSGGTP